MSTTCPNGHDSKWPDWCSVCGERLADATAAGDPDAGAGENAPPAASKITAEMDATAGPSAATAPPSGPSCDNCGVARHEDDVFCESCGYDFASGSLPEGSVPANDAAGAPAASAEPTTPMHARIEVDADFFAASVGDVDLTLPDPLPAAQVVPLPGRRILIGRKSTSRGIFPEIDVRALTDDPAVSSRHAMLERTVDDVWTLTDLGSTNGTFLTTDADNAIEAGIAISVTAGTTIFVGAWTKITIDETTV